MKNVLALFVVLAVASFAQAAPPYRQPYYPYHVNPRPLVVRPYVPFYAPPVIIRPPVIVPPVYYPPVYPVYPLVRPYYGWGFWNYYPRW